MCELLAARDRGEAPDWDCIARTPQWDVVHSNNTSLPGWLVLVLRRRDYRIQKRHYGADFDEES